MHANHHIGHGYQIYLSHSGHDLDVAKDLFNQLRRSLQNLPSDAIFCDRAVATDPIRDAVWKEAADSCKVGVLLISPNFLSSSRPMRELQRLVERSHTTRTISLYPIFYDFMKEIDECLTSETSVLDMWGSTWSSSGHDVDIQQWAQHVVAMRRMTRDMLDPNNLRFSIPRIARTITRTLRPKHGTSTPTPTSGQMNQKGVGTIVKQPAQCRYTTLGSLERAITHVSFYLQPVGYDDLHDNQRPKPGLLGQRPQCGVPKELAMVKTLIFENVKEAEAYTQPIGAGHEWWELIWADNRGGGNVVYGNDHSCWRAKKEQIHPNFVCLSPCFFKIHTLEQRKANKSLFGESSAILKRDYRPPSSDDVRGMVAVRKDLVTYVSGNELIKVWDDTGSGAAESLAIYTGSDFSGCFAFTTDSPLMNDECYPTLKRSIFG